MVDRTAGSVGSLDYRKLPSAVVLIGLLKGAGPPKLFRGVPWKHTTCGFVVDCKALRVSRGATGGRFLLGGFTERADMYAVIKTGGKQYKVAAGEKIKVEQIAADVGQEITIDQVLAIGAGADLKVGTPLVSGASVKATVVAQGRHDKVRIFKMRRRKHYQKRQGHRQAFTELEISAVNA